MTDIVMPGMSGTELAAAVVAGYPQAAIVYMSGYDLPDRDGDHLQGRRFLAKPFSAEMLAETLKTTLAESRHDTKG
jgi:YesN/AraC family two-component response regulator